MLLAACGGSGSSSNNSEILLWSSTTGPDGEKSKTIDQYNETDPDFKVKLVSMQGDTFTSKLTTAGKSGKGVPDLALIASEALPTYKHQDMLETWDDMIDGTELARENCVEAAWDTGVVDDSQYGIPATMGSWVMYYNQDLVDKYVPGALDDGVVTYEEIRQAGEKQKQMVSIVLAIHGACRIIRISTNKWVGNGKMHKETSISIMSFLTMPFKSLRIYTMPATWSQMVKMQINFLQTSS